MQTLDTAKRNLAGKLLPLTLTVAVILLDQITKTLVTKNIPLLTPFADDCVVPVVGDYIRLIHVRNKAIAFSLGSSLPGNIRRILFAFLPLIGIGIVFAIYFRNNEFSRTQRWAICGITGGGLGNLMDRFFRPDGVVDFIDCYFFGIFGLERWPTFNVADMAVVICGRLFVISFLLQVAKENKQTGNKEKNETEVQK